MRLLLNTARTVRQGDSVEFKYAPGYREATSVCAMHELDMLELGVVPGGNVRVRNGAGEVVLRLVERDDAERGTLFVPYGPYANCLIPAETHGTGMPDFKLVWVDVEPTDDERSTVGELMGSLGGVPYDS
ncbi:MAG: molybdopterin dinucleotide binding domain-containing protein [Methanomicrobiales archaeon]|nr:molybdopterin dinucleotide binding domain-containing protein [Methanomicrobiales archaeon]MDI6877123.1 molybdopterin dinucleotide binding domain-containing protein [Methanomicrobiales archaeon]